MLKACMGLNCSRQIDYVDRRSCQLTEIPDEIYRYEDTLEDLMLDSNMIQELPPVGNTWLILIWFELTRDLDRCMFDLILRVLICTDTILIPIHFKLLIGAALSYCDSHNSYPKILLLLWFGACIVYCQWNLLLLIHILRSIHLLCTFACIKLFMLCIICNTVCVGIIE